MIVCDTGPIVAAALVNDEHHHACVELFTGLHLAGRAMLVPATVVAEVGYLLERNAGPEVEALFLQSLAAGDFQPIDLTPADYRRMTDLVRRYADLPLGTTDASVIALTERLGLTEVATLDRRHFSVVRPEHTTALATSLTDLQFREYTVSASLSSADIDFDAKIGTPSRPPCIAALVLSGPGG